MRERCGLASCTDQLFKFTPRASVWLTLSSPIPFSLPVSLSQWFRVKEEEEKDDGESKDVSTPTHWAKLDPKSMKVRSGRACCLHIKQALCVREWMRLCSGEWPAQRARLSRSELQRLEVAADRSPDQAAEGGGAGGGVQGAGQTREQNSWRGRANSHRGRERSKIVSPLLLIRSGSKEHRVPGCGESLL